MAYSNTNNNIRFAKKSNAYPKISTRCRVDVKTCAMMGRRRALLTAFANTASLDVDALIGSQEESVNVGVNAQVSVNDGVPAGVNDGVRKQQSLQSRDDVLLHACESILTVISDANMRRLDVCEPRFGGGRENAVADAMMSLLEAYDMIQSEITSDDVRALATALRQRALASMTIVPPCSLPIA